MKISYTKYFLVLALVLGLACSLAAQRSMVASMDGRLLRADGRPLVYTEIELVPVDSDRLINDSRLIGVSGHNGNFKFPDIPPGSYTLSINFGDKPTFLSPYGTYFFPGSANRQEARVFEVKTSTRFKDIAFKLPPALVKQLIKGTVTWPDGSPVKGALIGCRDIEFEINNAFGSARTDENGMFSLEGFVGRTYQIGAIVFESDLTPFEHPGPIIAFGETQVFELKNDGTGVKVRVNRSREAQPILDKYTAQLIRSWEMRR